MRFDPNEERKSLAVLQMVYSHQIKRQDFGDLLSGLDEAIINLVQTELDSDGIPTRLKSLEKLEEHFELATQLDQKYYEEDEGPELTALCEGPTACFAIDESLRIIAMTETARDRLGDIGQTKIESLPLRNADIRTLKSAVRSIVQQSDRRAQDKAFFVRSNADERFSIFHTRHFRKSKVVVISFDHLVWNTFVDAALTRNFGLTPAENRVVRLLAEGQQPKEIAMQLERSIETVRSHIKTVQTKTHIHNTPALIRLACEIMAVSMHIDEDQNGAFDPKHNVPLDEEITVPALHAGQAFDVTQMVGIADPDAAQTAMFVHGMLQGPYITQHLRTLLRERQIEMVCPSRPGYGGTPPASNKEEFIETTVNHMLHVMDDLKIDKTVLVGHMVGTQFACRFAQRAPDRVRAVVAISGVIPMMSRAQLRQQATMHRMAMLAAKYSPATLRYIAQIGERYVNEGNELKCLAQLFARSRPDRDALTDPEFATLLKRGFAHLNANGRSAFIHECQAGTSDWTDDFLSISCKRIFLHGSHDAAVPIRTVETTVGQHEQWELKLSSTAGQTLLFTHPKEVADVLESGFRTTSATGEKHQALMGS